MSRKRVVLELLPGHIDLVVYDGQRRTDVRRLDIDTTDDASEWATIIRRSAVSLGEVVQSLGVAGAPATVLYRSPTQSIDISSFPVRSAGQAVEAAVMSCADALPYSALSAVSEASVVARDASGEPVQTHVAVAAEREDTAEAIAHLVDEAGLKLASATPRDVALMATFVAGELSDKSAHRGSLYVGAHMSFFAVIKGGRLLFSRRIDLGLESLAASLTGPIMIPGRGEPIELELDDGRALLHGHGVPKRDETVHEALGLTGGQVIPLLQPVLQRFIIELRQSLRFGVSEQDRESLAIRVSGPGAAIPGLVELLGEELGIAVEADPAYRDAGRWFDAGADRGELVDAQRDPALLLGLNLLPRKVAFQRRTGRLRRWMFAGTAAAAALIAVDAVRFHARVDAARMQADVYAAQIQDLAALEATGAQLAAVIGAKLEIERAIKKEIGVVVNYRACMHEISLLTPETIRLSTVKFDRSVDGMVATLSGFAVQTDGDADRTELEPFIARLQQSPLFENVVLGNVQMSAGLQKGQRFRATLSPVAIPRYADIADEIVATEGTDSP